MPEISLLKQPHTQQQKFLDCDAPEQLYGGAKRGGKSIALCQKMTLLSFFFPGNRILLSRYNFTDLKDTTLADFFTVCPPALIVEHNKTDRRILLKTMKRGVYSEILYRGLGDEQEFEKTKSLTIGALVIDEPTEVPLAQYLMLRAQLTWQLPDGSRPKYMCLLASNPEPGWVEDRFILEEHDGCVFIPSLPRDNPFLPPGYEAELRKDFPSDWVKKYLDGQWGASEGAIFKELDERWHDLDQFVDERDYVGWTWNLALVDAVDHATTGVTACLLCGCDAAGNNYWLDEYYEKDQLISYHAANILAQRSLYCSRPRGGDRQVQFTLMDPSCFHKTLQGTSGQTVNDRALQAVADEYRENGVWAIPAWNALEMGINRIKEHLHVGPKHMHPFTGQMGSPSLFISKSRCPNAWKQMRGLKRKVNSVTRTVQIIGVDHALDCGRYFINSQPQRPEVEMADSKYSTSMDRLASEQHRRWVQRFAGGPDGSARQNTWFSGMGMTYRDGGGMQSVVR